VCPWLMLRDAISNMSGPGVAVSTTAAAAKSMMVDESGISIPCRLKPEFSSIRIRQNGKDATATD
jgi:hypothetical protein